MRRIRLTVAYDGTAYHGWQVQKNGETIESVLNRQLSALLKEPIQVIGASRTDAGVHALGNVAVFDTESRMPGERISYALNQWLPPDIRIQESAQVAASFHPRKAACTKFYEYQILNRDFELPQLRLYAHFFRRRLHVAQMQAACPYFLGEHDFKSFCSIHTQAETTVRTIYHLDVKREQDLIRIQVSGNGFLYNMVRIIAGTLIQIGSGMKEPEEIPLMIGRLDRQSAGPTAPAKGLTLLGMKYEGLEFSPKYL